MSTDQSPRKPTNTPISAADFPALRTFLRGYFHQDMKDEYGTPAEAVREFCEDASGEERAAVAKDWLRFLDQTKGQPLGEVNRILTGPLGSSCSLTDDDVHQITAALTLATRKRR